MARKRSKSRRSLRLYLVAALALATFAAAGIYWWDMRSFRPDEARYPDQGVAVDERAGLVGFQTVRALGGKFAYLGASYGADGQDARFTRNLAAARAAGLRAGAVHLFDPCQQADAQSANFARVVPRDVGLLPPAIVLRDTADGCEQRVSDAAVESELTTFINQVEMHVGQAAILKLHPSFEDRHRIAAQVERDLWLVRDRFPPRYAPRPWLLWSANSDLDSEAAEEPVEWVVVQP